MGTVFLLLLILHTVDFLIPKNLWVRPCGASVADLDSDNLKHCSCTKNLVGKGLTAWGQVKGQTRAMQLVCYGVQ